MDHARTRGRGAVAVPADARTIRRGLEPLLEDVLAEAGLDPQEAFLEEDDPQDDERLVLACGREALAESALTRLRGRVFAGALGLAALAGGAGGMLADGNGPKIALDAGQGVVLFVLAVGLGGFLGLTLRSLARVARGRSIPCGEGCVDGPLLCGFVGSLVGLVLALVLADPQALAALLPQASALGAFALSVPGGAFGDEIELAARRLAAVEG